MQAVGDLPGALLLTKFQVPVPAWMDLVVRSGHGGCPCGLRVWFVPSSSSPHPGSAPLPHWHAGGSPGLRLSNCRVLFLAWFPEEKAAYVIVLSVSAFPPTSLLLTSFEPPVKFSRRDGELQDVTFPCKLAAGAPSSGGDGAGTGGDAGESERGEAGNGLC